MPHSTHRYAAAAATRASLIAAATDVFLEDGFRAARVQDIAQRAGHRLSAINYHFGGKEGLYLAVLQHHADLAVSARPLTPPDDTLPLRQRFDFAIHAVVSRVLGTAAASQIGPLLLRELVNPTDALEVLFEHFTRPQAMRLRTLLEEILGPKVPEVALGRAMISVFGQCVAYVTARPMILRLMPGLYQTDDFIARTAAHVAAFSWAGLQALRAQWEEET